jgi:hypothetical protein
LKLLIQLQKIKEKKELAEKLTGEKIDIGNINNIITEDIKSNLPKDYKSWSIVEKISLVLIQNKRCLTTRQIVERLNKLESIEKPNFYGTVSGIITNKIQKEKLFNRYIPYKGKEYYVGLKDWFDENGNIHEEYKAI